MPDQEKSKTKQAKAEHHTAEGYSASASNPSGIFKYRKQGIFWVTGAILATVRENIADALSSEHI